MNRMTSLAVVIIAAILMPLLASADQVTYDPLTSNIIYASGEAEIIVPVNGFKISFNFELDKASFKEANDGATKIIEEITAAVKSLGLNNIEVIKGWDIVRQAKISLSAKGRKIANRIQVQVIDYPEGKLHELIATIIDKSLAVSPLVALNEVQVFVSADMELKKKDEVTAQAIKALEANATRTATTLGRKIVAPKRIFVNEEDIFGKNIVKDEPEYLAAYATKRFISIQKSFRVEAQIVDKMSMLVKVYGIYQIE